MRKLRGYEAQDLVDKEYNGKDMNVGLVSNVEYENKSLEMFEMSVDEFVDSLFE